MFFPIGDDQVRGGHKPIFSYLFIGVNIFVFLYEISLTANGLNFFFTEYGVIPIEITNGQDLHTLFTSMFIHNGWLHLVGNMLFLWVFADNIEAITGSFVFVLFYISGGIVADLAHVLIDIDSTNPTVGASGAISAVMGAYLVMFPTSRIKIWAFFFVFRILAIYFLGFWIFNQLIDGFNVLNPSSGFNSNVAFWAHIGGFLFGLVAGFFFRLIYDVKLIKQPKPLHSYQSKKGREQLI